MKKMQMDTRGKIHDADAEGGGHFAQRRHASPLHGLQLAGEATREALLLAARYDSCKSIFPLPEMCVHCGGR